MMVRNIFRHFISRPRDFIPLLALYHDNISPLSNPPPASILLFHYPNNHFYIRSSIEFSARHTNGEVDITQVMIDRAPPGISPQKIDMRKINLCKGVLVSAYYDSRSVPVEKEHMTLWLSCEEICLEGEVEVGISRVRKNCSC